MRSQIKIELSKKKWKPEYKSDLREYKAYKEELSLILSYPLTNELIGRINALNELIKESFTSV